MLCTFGLSKIFVATFYEVVPHPCLSNIRSKTFFKWESFQNGIIVFCQCFSNPHHAIQLRTHMAKSYVERNSITFCWEFQMWAQSNCVPSHNSIMFRQSNWVLPRNHIAFQQWNKFPSTTEHIIELCSMHFSSQLAWPKWLRTQTSDRA